MKNINKRKFSRTILGYVVLREHFLYCPANDDFSLDITIQTDQFLQQEFSLKKLVRAFELYFNSDCMSIDLDLKSSVATLHLKSVNYLPF